MTKCLDNTSDIGRVYAWLKTVTVDYRFRPGEQLMVGELAEHLRVSSTPVREALIRLQAEALLDIVPRRGFYAKTLNLKEMTDLFQFRFLILKSSIEQVTHLPNCAAGGAVRSLAPGEYKRGNVALGADTAGPFDRLIDHVRYIERVSESVAALSDNNDLVRAVVNANERTHYVHMIDLEVAERLNNALSMFDQLSEALQRKDVARAIITLKSHFDDQIPRMADLVKEGISRAYASPRWKSALPQPDVPPPALIRPPMASRVTSGRN